METLVGKHWHHLPAEEVLDLLESDPAKGLDHFKVVHRQKRFGPNRITPKGGKGPLWRFLLQFHQPLVYILLSAGLITGLLSEWVDASVIIAVVLTNAIIGFIQETKAVKAIQALSASMTMKAVVVRAGRRQSVDAAEVVPGDMRRARFAPLWRAG